MPPTPPVVSGAVAETEKYLALLSKLQRDINRSQDADRNTRRRGLQKLIDDIPWTGNGGSGTKKATRTLLVTNVLVLNLMFYYKIQLVFLFHLYLIEL